MSDEKTWEDEFFKNNKLMDVSSYQDDRIRDWIKLARYSGYMEACKKRNEENEQLKQQLEEMTNKCAEVNFDKNCLVSDLNERGKDLFHLRDHNKKLADQNRELKQQLESLKHEYREKLGYLSSNKWTDKTALSVEMERLEKEELRDRLENETTNTFITSILRTK